MYSSTYPRSSFLAFLMGVARELGFRRRKGSERIVAQPALCR
ncbi:MAG: hypothetical protein ACPGNT_05055 [Rhodospirillales bacterium]